MRESQTRRRVVTPFIACAVVACLCGCESVPEFAAPRVVPDEVAFVRDNSGQFAQSESDPLADTPVGTVIDDLAGLTGCWGAYSVILAEEGTPLVTAGEPLLETSELFSIDVDAGEMSFQILQRDALGVLTAVVTYQGILTLLDERRAAFDITSFSTNDPQTGDIITLGSDEFEQDLVWQFLFTLDGDRMKAVFSGEGDEEPAADGPEIVYFRFDCP